MMSVRIVGHSLHPQRLTGHERRLLLKTQAICQDRLILPHWRNARIACDVQTAGANPRGRSSEQYTQAHRTEEDLHPPGFRHGMEPPCTTFHRFGCSRSPSSGTAITSNLSEKTRQSQATGGLPVDLLLERGSGSALRRSGSPCPEGRSHRRSRACSPSRACLVRRAGCRTHPSRPRSTCNHMQSVNNGSIHHK